MSIQASHIHNVDVGTPPSSLNEWEIIKVRYHGFENLTTTRNEYVRSPEFTCFGNLWCLRVYPGGSSTSDDGMVSIYLQNLSNKSIKLQYGFCVKDESHKVKKDFVSKKGGAVFPAGGTRCGGTGNFCERSTIIKNLVDGTLTIEVRMRNISEEITSAPFIPENPIAKNILSMFNDEETADVVFEVENERVETSSDHKRARTMTSFYAHCNILQKCCSSALLGELCQSGADAINAVLITDVKPEVFRHLLYYVYGGKLPDEELKSNAKEIIDAADKYGIVGLKLEAEAAFVTSETITFDNAIDNLLYADATNCALLKETVLDFIAENGSEASEKLSFEHVPGNVIPYLLAALTKGKQKENDANDFSMMRISDLRKMLAEKGLDIDGSREMMIARLEESP